MDGQDGEVSTSHKITPEGRLCLAWKRSLADIWRAPTTNRVAISHKKKERWPAITASINLPGVLIIKATTIRVKPN